MPSSECTSPSFLVDTELLLHSCCLLPYSICVSLSVCGHNLEKCCTSKEYKMATRRQTCVFQTQHTSQIWDVLIYISGILNDETYSNILSILMQFLIDNPRRYAGWCYDKWSKSLFIWDDTGAEETTSVHLPTPYDQSVLCGHLFQIE